MIDQRDRIRMRPTNVGGVRDVRKSVSHEGDVTDMRKVCQLVERCDGYVDNVRRLWGGVIVVRKCDSPQRGVKGITKVCQSGVSGRATVMREV